MFPQLTYSCPNNVFPDLTAAFQHGSNDFLASSETNFRWFLTQTDPFILAGNNPPNDFYILSCYVDYCYLPSDPRCQDVSSKMERVRVSVDLGFLILNTEWMLKD